MACGLFSCGMQTLSCGMHVGISSLTRDRTRPLALGAQSLIHCTTREVPVIFYMLSHPLGWMRGFSTLGECSMVRFRKKEDKRFVLLWWSGRKRIVAEEEMGVRRQMGLGQNLYKGWGSGSLGLLGPVSCTLISTYVYMKSTAFHCLTFGNQAL